MVQYDTELFLRKAVPLFRNLGEAPSVGDTSSLKHLKDHKYELTRTKGELMREYGGWMTKVHMHTVVAWIAALVSMEFIFEICSGNINSFTLGGATLSTGYAMYKWWKSGATYSNWQQFEMRPVLVPVEDVSIF